jgi:hypothetical protein
VAIGDALRRETLALASYKQDLMQHSPFVADEEATG